MRRHRHAGLDPLPEHFERNGSLYESRDSAGMPIYSLEHHGKKSVWWQQHVAPGGLASTRVVLLANRLQVHVAGRQQMKLKRSGNEAGFTLVELMVAAVLLLIVMAGFLPLFLQGLSQTSAARYKSMATNIAREKIEQIRQLDYREITDDTLQPGNLYELFGSSVEVPERNMTYLIDYDVVENAMPGQAVKSVEVTVTWDAPPIPSPAVVKTLIAQQYLGPRGGWLEVEQYQRGQSCPWGNAVPLAVHQRPRHHGRIPHCPVRLVHGLLEPVVAATLPERHLAESTPPERRGR